MLWQMAHQHRLRRAPHGSNGGASRSRHVVPWLAGLLLLGEVGQAQTAHADIWRCRAEQDEVHFTNVAPRGRARRRCRKVVSGNDTQKRQGVRSRQTTRSTSRRRGTRLPDRYQRYNAMIQEAAGLYHLPPAFLRSVIKVESDFTHDVVSHAGAMGLMQLMPRTAAAMGVRDAFDPRQNILGGARYLRILANLFNGDLILTIAAYNAGEGAVMRHHGVPPYSETQRYVRNVLSRYYRALRGPTR